jgi:cellulose synthase operon protein C
MRQRVLCLTVMAAMAWAQGPSATGRALKPTREAEAARSRRGPAQVDFRTIPTLPEIERESLADKKRESQIEAAKRLVPRIEDGSPQKAELLFQLAELYWERTRFLYGKEMRAFFDAQQAASEKSDGAEHASELKADHRQSGLYRAETQRLYETILREYPKYGRKDEVLFNVADTLYESDRKAEAAKRYEELVESYPKSKFVADAQVNLGNYYFDIANQLGKARENYQRAFASESPRIKSYALYKLAWCDFNAGDYEKALKKLQDTVAFAEKQAGGELAKAFRDLKSEALQDMVRVFAQLNQSAEAVAYFRERTALPKRAALMARLGFQLIDAGHFENAIVALRAALSESPTAAPAPEYQQAIVRAYEGLRKRDEVKQAVAQMAEYYRPDSAWWKANAENKTVLRNGFQVAEEVMRKTVTDYHQEAIQTKQRSVYLLAKDIYRQYVDGFASNKDEAFVSDQAFNLKFYYAEILWALDDFENAAKQYAEVAAFQIPSRPDAVAAANEKYRQTAAYNAILSYEKLVKKERGQTIASSATAAIDEKKKKGVIEKTGRIERRSVKELEEKPLTLFEQSLVAACDAYNQRFSKTPDEVDIAYQAALILYQKNHFVEAAKRFGEIIDGHPQDRRSRESADLSMAILEEKGEWLALSELSQKLKANTLLSRGDADFARRLQSVVEGSQFKYADEVLYRTEKNPSKSLDAFESFAKAFPSSENADRALTFAMQIATETKQLQRAAQLGQQVLKLYPLTVFDLKVKYGLAKISERRAEYQAAATWYKTFVESYDLVAGPALKGQSAKKSPPTKGSAPAVVSVSLTQLKTETQRKEREKLLAECVRAEDHWLQNAVYNIAFWNEQVGNFDLAAGAYSTYLSRFQTAKDAAAVAVASAAVLQKKGAFVDAAKAFERLSGMWRQDPSVSGVFKLEAKYQQLVSFELAKSEGEMERSAKELVAFLEAASDEIKRSERARLAEAHARFVMLESFYRRYQALQFKRVASFKSERVQKEKRLFELEKAYTAVLALGEPTFAVASLTRIGQLYADFAANISALPDPPGLDESQLNLFRGELESRYVFPVEEKAVEAFEKAVEKGTELRLLNQWVTLAQDKLNVYRPGRFQPAKTFPFQVAEIQNTKRLDGVATEVSASTSETRRTP